MPGLESQKRRRGTPFCPFERRIARSGWSNSFRFVLSDSLLATALFAVRKPHPIRPVI